MVLCYYYIGDKMEKITNKKILNVFTLCILIMVPFLKFFSMNLEMFGIMRNYDFINPAIILYVSVPFLIFIYIKDIIDKKRNLHIYDYLFYILVFVGILSCIFSMDKMISIFGKSFRHEGFLSILNYYLLFINWKENGNKEDIKKFLKFLIILAVINSIYALFQMYTNFDFVLTYFDHDVKMASGMCGNPNFFGSLIVTVLAIVTCKFLIEKENLNYKKILLLIFLFVSLINSESTGPILTYIIFLLFLFIFLGFKKYKISKRSLIVLIIIVATYLFLIPINNNFVVDKAGNKINKNETSISSIKKTIGSGGNGRLKIWENSLDIVKDNPIVGVGFDNFELAYPNPKIPTGVMMVTTKEEAQPPVTSYYIVDNAHNVYLHTAVSTGILGLIPYLLLCLFVFIKGLKFKNKLGILLLSGFVAYSIQAFANISVIQVAPIYYIILGLILSLKEEPNKTSDI